ncbi:hypothetical protein CDL12_17922 [Handroanthus impetiginosus]|uniref:BRO1 domain-containing protein n=1 Tax=Handroanthus impetiginosus TaxID=429701 RepID=A0A2G9GW78_9LAMI|nr:hypothetical protein CDL12_17922 [Handroanthus impetiginosus]
MMISYPGLSKMKTTSFVYQDVFPASDLGTLEELKELSSKRKAIEDSVNGSSVTEAIAREMSGGLTSRHEQDIRKLEQYLPLLENLCQNIDLNKKNGKVIPWTSGRKIKWSSVLTASSIFHFEGPKFYSIFCVFSEHAMTLFLYAALLHERALEVLSSEAVPSVCNIMSLICLAQAQAVTARKAEENGNTGGLLAKLHSGVKEFLVEAINILQSATKCCKSISSRLQDFLLSSKTLHELMSYKYLVQSLKNEGKIGIAIGVLRLALANAKKYTPKEESWKLVSKQMIDELKVLLQKYEHENDFVWHEKIAYSDDDLPSPQAVRIVHLIPYQRHNLERTLVFKC